MASSFTESITYINNNDNNRTYSPSGTTNLDGTEKKLQYEFTDMLVDCYMSPIFCVQFNYFCQENSIFACTGINRVSIYECLLNGELKRLQQYTTSPEEKEVRFFTCAWSHVVDGHESILAVAGSRGAIRIINTKTMTMTGPNRYIGHRKVINELKFDPNDCYLLLSASEDCTIRLWNIKFSVCIAVFRNVKGYSGSADNALSIDYNSAGNRFVSCGTGNVIIFWRTDSDAILRAVAKLATLDVDESPISRFKPARVIPHPLFHLNRNVCAKYMDCIRLFGSFIISKSNDGKLKFWKLNDIDGPLYLVHVIQCENCDDLLPMKFSMDFSQKILALGNRFGKIFVWNLYNSEYSDLTTIQCTTLNHIRSNSTIRHTALDRDGLILIAVGDDGSIWRWNRTVSEIDK